MGPLQRAASSHVPGRQAPEAADGHAGVPQVPWTGIGDLGCCHIADGLRQNGSLTRVDLSGNNASYSACVVFAEMLASNTTLEALMLHHSPLTQVCPSAHPCGHFRAPVATSNRCARLTNRVAACAVSRPYISSTYHDVTCYISASYTARKREKERTYDSPVSPGQYSTLEPTASIGHMRKMPRS